MCIPIVVIAVTTKKIEFPKSHWVAALVFPITDITPLSYASLTSVNKVDNSLLVMQEEWSAVNKTMYYLCWKLFPKNINVKFYICRAEYMKYSYCSTKNIIKYRFCVHGLPPILKHVKLTEYYSSIQV